MQFTSPSLTLSICGCYWRYALDDAKVDQLIQTNGVSRTLAICLAQRDLLPGKQIANFLSPSISDLHDPFLMLGMDKAIDRLKKAIIEQESVRIVTDYDVDGTMSSLILQSALAICGHNRLTYHIPNRKDEGYGFTGVAAQKAIQDHVKLIVTADIGVRDEAAIHLAQSHGIDVIVLDHHLPIGEGVPPSAYAVLCPPQKDCPYPNKALAACGISLKLAQALLKDHPKCPAIIRSLMKLAALGTVADVVSLLEQENRAIVAIGLDALNRDDHKPGLRALLNISKALPGTISSSTISFHIGPHINAAGRLASATHIIELLHAPNSVVAQGLASQLSEMNIDRQQIQEQMIHQAIEEIGESEAPFIVIARPESPTWHSGISGIVAGRLREYFHRPVAVATIENGMMTGSIRSTPGVHAVKALTSVEKWLVKFGGHAAAAGFSCPESALEPLASGLCENALEQLEGAPEIPITDVALCLEPGEITLQVCNEIDALEPCGAYNPKPLICIKNASVYGLQLRKEKHLAGYINGSPIELKFIWFSAPITMAELSAQPHHLLGELQKNVWNGRESLQFVIRDAAISNEDVFV